jgi:chemotaxis protein histidine kinase CheA
MENQFSQDAALVNEFLVESQELLHGMDQDMVALESAPQNDELLNRIFRALHTIKGTSGFLGFAPMVRLAHHAEEVLNHLRRGEIALTRPRIDALLAARDQLNGMLADVRNGGLQEYEIAGLLAQLEAAALVQASDNVPKRESAPLDGPQAANSSTPFRSPVADSQAKSGGTAAGSMVLLEEQKKQLNHWTFEILATDLNERSLAQAEQGHFDGYSTRNLPERFKQYFSAKDGNFQVVAEVKANVKFERVNLSDSSRMSTMRGMDVVLCCNVLIYFDSASKREVIGHFYGALLSHGYLFLGHAESLYGVNEDFRLVHLTGCTAYVKATNASIASERRTTAP